MGRQGQPFCGRSGSCHAVSHKIGSETYSRHSVEKARRRGTVYYAMIKGQAECNHLARNDSPFVDGRLADDSSNSKNRCLGQVDDGSESVNTIHAQIRDRECPPLHRLKAQTFLVRAFYQARSFRRDFAQRLCCHVTQHRRQQPLFCFDREAMLISL